MDSIGMNAVKYLLFFFNLIFSISGIGIISVGAVVLHDVTQFSHFLEGRILTPPIILIVIGTMVFFIAFLGCFGAIRENFVMLISFAVALLVIFLIEMAIGVAAAVFVSDFKSLLNRTLRESIENNSDADKKAWENIQTTLQCCGVDSPRDWNNVMPEGSLPQSCCKQSQDDQSECKVDSDTVYPNNCFRLLEIKVTVNANLLTGVGIGIAFVEVAGIILACCLAMAIRRECNK